MRVVNSSLTAGAMLICVASTPASARNWVPVGSSMNNAAAFYDPESIQRYRNYVTVWTRTDYSRNPNTKIREDITRVRYDCLSKTSTNLVIVFYYLDGSNQSAEYAPHEQTERTVVPGSMGELMLMAVCE